MILAGCEIVLTYSSSRIEFDSSSRAAGVGLGLDTVSKNQEGIQ